MIIHPTRRQVIIGIGAMALSASSCLGLAKANEQRINPMKHSQIDIGPVELHVVEIGEGEPVVFCHGFPDLWIGWRRQMEVLAANGFHAIAFDMRGFGRSSTPLDKTAYTPFHTVGDVVGLLDALGLEKATIVGHDFGAAVAWNAALMRPDRFSAVVGVSVPYIPRSDRSYLDALKAAGKEDSFYMFSEMQAHAAERWKDAAVTLPGAYYWSSGTPAPSDRWDPFDTERARMRKAPVPFPPWADPQDIAYAIREFERTGFQGGLNYYHSIQPGFDLSAAYKGAIIEQPSLFIFGLTDGLNRITNPSEAKMRKHLPGLRGFVAFDEVGHWPQQERPHEFNKVLLEFLTSRN